MMKNGCVKGVLSGSIYKNAWIVHNVVSEVPERLLFTRFLTQISGENIQ